MDKQLFGDAYISWKSKHIVLVDHLKDWDGKDDLDTAREVVRGIRSFTYTQDLCAILVSVANLYKEREILDLFQQSDFREIARALLIKSFAAKLVGNMYLRMAKGKPNEAGRIIPTKLFTNQEKAIAWLEQQITAHQNDTDA